MGKALCTWGLTGCLLTIGICQTVVKVTSINPPPGDLYTHSGSNYRFVPFFHMWNWYYGHIQNGGSVGINTVYPRAGNGSVYFETPTAAAKSDIEYRFLSNTEYWGRLADLEWLSYEWYRDASSTVDGYIHLPIRIYVANFRDGRLQDLGYLIYERSMNGMRDPVPTNQWVFEEVAASNKRFWQNPIGLGNFFDAQPLSVWQSAEGYQPRNGNRIGVHWNGDSVVCGISVGAGTGWNGRFVGAVDNITIKFRNGVWYHFNFEVRPHGDVNGDGIVDDTDLLLILNTFGQSCSGCPYDLNRDGSIDDADLLIVLIHFGMGG